MDLESDYNHRFSKIYNQSPRKSLPASIIQYSAAQNKSEYKEQLFYNLLNQGPWQNDLINCQLYFSGVEYASDVTGGRFWRNCTKR